MIKKIIYLAFLLPLAGNAQTTVIKPLVKQPTAFAIITDNQTYANTKEATAEHPFQFISGLGLTLESFEDQVKDLKAGDKFDFTIACADAYGDFDEEHVIDLPKQIFEVDGKFDSERIVAGNVVPLMTSEGQRINGTVQEIKADVVVMDMNHPLAGCDLNFVGEVIESRPATNEELAEIARMMSGGGCSCGCDSCGDGCGDGCGDHDHQGCGCNH